MPDGCDIIGIKKRGRENRCKVTTSVIISDESERKEEFARKYFMRDCAAARPFTESKAGNSSPVCLLPASCCNGWDWTKAAFCCRLDRRILKSPICKRKSFRSTHKADLPKHWKKIARLETLVVPQDKLAQQFILRAKALAGYECDGKRCPYDYPTQRQMLMQALDMTHPNFDLEKIERCLLSIEDMKSLNQIAITYSETGDRRFAIRIYEQLMKYPRNRLFNNEALLTVTPMLCYNFSRLLGRERRYEEELEIAQYGYDISLKYDKARLLGGLLLNMGCALHELGRDEESKEKLIDSYYAYRLINNKKSCALVANYAKGKYDIILE